jgi:hypothetical protein
VSRVVPPKESLIYILKKLSIILRVLLVDLKKSIITVYCSVSPPLIVYPEDLPNTVTPGSSTNSTQPTASPKAATSKVAVVEH